jgi:hypothetical protein
MSRIRAALAALLVALLAAGCTQLDNRTYELADVLAEAGFEDAYVDYWDYGSQGAALRVDYLSQETGVEAIEQEAERAARLLWHRGRLRIAKVDVDSRYEESVDVPPTFSWTDERMRAEFGPRSASLDVLVSDDIEPSFVRGLRIAALVLAGLVVVAVVITVLLVRRHRRRRPPAAMGWTEYAPPGYGAPYWYGPQPGYGPAPGSGIPPPGYGAPPGYGPAPGSGPPPSDIWAPPTGR